MTISKLLPVLCALAVGVTGITARADADADNPAQAAARATLAKQLFDQSAPATSASAADTNAVMQPVNSKEAKAKAKAEKAAAKAKAKREAAEAQAAAVQPTADAAKSQADQKADAERAALAAALMDRMNAEAQAKSAAQTASNSTATATLSGQPTKADQEKEQKPATVLPVTTAPGGSTATNDYAGKDLGMKPIAAPPLPISASKQERLEALLVKYKADQITPEEYHQQRAAILAEP